MNLYIPTENLASQYPDWGKWKPIHFQKIPCSRELRQEGALLFVEGKVSELEPLRNDAGFEARVEDGKSYGVAVRLDAANWPTPHLECGCPKGSKSRPCRHTLALLAGLVYLFHEHNFIPLSPLLDNVNALAAAIDRAPKPKRKKTLKRLRLRNLAEGRPYLEGDAPLPDELVQAINPYRELSRMARNTLELPLTDVVSRIRNLIGYAKEKRARIEAERPDGSFVKLTAELESVGTRLRFTAMPRKGLVLFEPAFEEGDDDGLIAQIGDHVQILEPGRIARIDDAKFEAVPLALAQMERGFSSFSRRGDTLPLETINDFICRLSDAQRRLLRQCKFATSEGGTLAHSEPSEEPTLPVQVTLDIGRDEAPTTIGRGRQSHLATLFGEVSDEHLDLHHIFGDFMKVFCDHAESSNRLLGSRARVDLLLEAAANMPQIKTQRDRRAYLESIGQRHEFAKKSQAEAATRLLRQLEQDYCRPRSAVAPMCLRSDASGIPIWRNVALPLTGLLAITARLYRHSDFQRLIKTEPATLPIQLTGEALHEIATACEAFGINLKVDESQTLSRYAEIQVDCLEDKKEDWFELKPSIRCAGLKIPAEQWEALLNNQLLLEGEDGQQIAPRVERPELLAQLIDATRSSRGGKGKARVHRLHLLDWVALRKQGLELSLPEGIETLLRSLQHFDGIPHLPPPKGLEAQLRPYQQRGFEWLVFLYQHRLGACLADDMGLGKTLQTIAFLLHLRESQTEKSPLSTLAVLPPSLIFNWEIEIARFAPSLHCASYTGPERDSKVIEEADVVLTTYDTLRRDVAKLSEYQFGLLVFDEAQVLKNHASRRTAAARQLNGRFSLCLTGTPMENHIGEYHTIMDLALPGLMGERKDFLQRLKEGDNRPLHRAQPFLLRRSKGAILKELPDKIESDIALAMDDVQSEIYTRIVAEVREEVREAYAEKPRSQAGIAALAALTRLRQACVAPALLGYKTGEPSPKMEYLTETITELLSEGHSVLVFSQFVKALDEISTHLKARSVKPLRLDGKTRTPQRKRAVEKFQKSDQPEVFLISLKAGGVGLNLTRASYVIHVDPWWNPSVENQASDRAHRIGQQQTVFIQRLLMRDSVEEKIMALKARKQRLFDAIVGGADSGSQGAPVLKKEDFEFLLSDETGPDKELPQDLHR